MSGLKRVAVVALGGNAITGRGLSLDIESQWSAVSRAASSIAEMVVSGWSVVVTHGNGPQVGYILESIELLDREKQPVYIATAMTQGWIGFLIKHALERDMAARGLGSLVPVVITRVVVDPRDPEFHSPSKPVGRFYTREEALRLEREKGWRFSVDPRRGYRRVVPSPRPSRVVDLDLVIDALEKRGVVIAVGGGGIPVVERGGVMEPVEAVIDKDLASGVLAAELNAQVFVILTDVPGVAINYGKAGETWLKRATVGRMKKLLREGHFPPGSMGPKVEAAILFVESTGKPAVIGSLNEAQKVLNLESGTVITP